MKLVMPIYFLKAPTLVLINRSNKLVLKHSTYQLTLDRFKD